MLEADRLCNFVLSVPFMGLKNVLCIFMLGEMDAPQKIIWCLNCVPSRIPFVISSTVFDYLFSVAIY